MTNKGQLGQALVDAVMLQQHGKVLELIKSGADLNCNMKGDMAIHLAARNADKAVLTALIEAGDDVNKGNQNGNTAIHFVARNGREDLVRYLKKCGADINIPNEDGDTPLHCCVGYLPMDVIESYINLGMNVNKQNKNGDTPLHVAVSFSRDESVEALLLCKANVNITNYKGQQPYQVAKNENICELLKMHSMLAHAKDKGNVMAEGTRLSIANSKFPMFFKRTGIRLESVSNTEQSSLSFYCRREKFENKSVTFTKEAEEEVVSDVFHFRVRDVIDDITARVMIPLYSKPTEKQELNINFVGSSEKSILTEITELDRGVSCTHDLILIPEKTTVVIVCLRAKVQTEIVGDSAECVTSEVEKDFQIDIPAETFDEDTEMNLMVYDVDKNMHRSIDDDTDSIYSKTSEADEIDTLDDITVDDDETFIQDTHVVSNKPTFKSFYDIRMKRTNSTGMDGQSISDETIYFQRKTNPRKRPETLLSDVFQIDLNGKQPNKSIKLQVPLCENIAKLGPGDIKVVRVDDVDKTIHEVKGTPKIEGNNVEFETDHFSTFVVCPFRCTDLSQVYSDMIDVKQRRQSARFFVMIRTLEDQTSHILMVECIRSQLSSKRRKHWRNKQFVQQKPKHSPKIMLVPSQEFLITLTGDAKFDTSRGETGKRTVVFSPHRASYQPYQITLTSSFKDGKATVRIRPTNVEEFNVVESKERKLDIALDIQLPLPPDEDPYVDAMDLEDAFLYESTAEKLSKLRDKWFLLVAFRFSQHKRALIEASVGKYGEILEKRHQKAVEEEQRRTQADGLQKKRTLFPTDILK